MQKGARCISLDVCDYTNNLLCNLYDSSSDISGQAFDVFVKTERNGFKELRFKLPSKCTEVRYTENATTHELVEDGVEEADNFRLQYLISDYRIRLLVKSDDNAYETDWFLISENKITHDFSKNYEVVASHISQLLRTKNLDLEFSDTDGNNVGTISQIAATILEGTGWHLGEVYKFYEEEKFLNGGEKVEKVRSFTSAAKTGAFKMISDLCDLFDAKPIYHGEGTYAAYTVKGTNPSGTANVVFAQHLDSYSADRSSISAETAGWKNVSIISEGNLTGRTVDILPMNPFSKDTTQGVVPEEVAQKQKVLELHYDKNVKNLSRTLKTDTLVTKLSSYGSYGDLNGMCSLQTAEHAVLTFKNLTKNKEYSFKYNEAYYYFTPTVNMTEAKWSALDFVSRSYIYYNNNIIKVYKEHQTDNVTEITNYTTESVRNYFPYVMDFSYYQRVGLLNDNMLKDLAKFQQDVPSLYQTSEEASSLLGDAEYELMQTASDGEGFLRLDVTNVNKNNSFIQLNISTSTHQDGVIYRSDYDEGRRSHFTWRPAKGIKDNGEALNAIGSIVYVVRQGKPTKWLKSYVKFIGNADGYYVFDENNNKYIKPNFGTYDVTSNGNENTIYLDDANFKMYIWSGSKYVQVQAANYIYGTKDFKTPTRILLWSTDMEFTYNSSKDYVYLFSANSIAGMFGPREDAVESNVESVKKSVQIVSETHQFEVLYNRGQTVVAPDPALARQNYGWYYVMNYGSETDANYFKFGTLYFLWKNYETNWTQVYVSFDGTVPPVNYSYYYNVKGKSLWRQKLVDGTYQWVEFDKDVTEENAVVNAFETVVKGCMRHEVLVKGLAEKYTYNSSSKAVGNYAFRNEFGYYWLFTTTQATGYLNYVVKDKVIWQDQDEHHIIKPKEYTFDVIEFPVANELTGLIYNEGDFKEETFYRDGKKWISENIYLYEKVTYKASLPAGTIVVYCDTSGKYLGQVTRPSQFTTPAHTNYIRLVCNDEQSEPTASHYIRVDNYQNKLFVEDVEYTLITLNPVGERTGLPALMDKFISLADEAYNVRLPALKAAQQNIKTATVNLMEELGDMYKEGYWQKNDYVGGDENKLYTDSLDNLKEISQPEVSYEFSYLDLYAADETGQSIEGFTDDVNWPDVDITYAAHLADPDIDTNCWAYIDTIDKCYDQQWKTTIAINTKLTNMGQQSFTDVLANIAEVANQVKAKQTIYDRAGYIGDGGKLAAERLEGFVSTSKLFILGGTSNWYTDAKGNIIFEDADGQSAMMLSGRGFMVASTKDAFGDWEWRTIGTGYGFSADAIYTGYLSAARIEAGSITADKLSATAGCELEIGSNKALALYATKDGTRPAGSLETMHPDKDDSWIAIAGAYTDENGTYHDAYVAVKSGGHVILEAGGVMDIEGSTVNIKAVGNDNASLNITSGGSVTIDATGQFTVISDNFTVKKENNKQVVKVQGEIIADSGKIAGLNIGSATGRTYLYSGSTQSVSSTAKGFYLGTDGLNIGGKFVYNNSDGTTTLKIEADKLTIGTSTYAADQSAINTKFNATIIESVEVYKVGESKDKAPSLINTDNKGDSTWDTEVPKAEKNNSNNKEEYIWSTYRNKSKDGKYYYGTPICEDNLSYNSKAAATASAIANGDAAVPYVDATNITIQNGLLKLQSTAEIQMIGNTKLYFGTSSSNSAFLLNKDGIAIGTGKNLAIAANGTLDLQSGSTMQFANSSGTEVFKLDKDDGVTIKSAKGISMATGGTLSIGGGSLSIASNSTFTVDSTNFKIDSSGNVSVDGKIYVKSGSTIAGWNIGSDYIGSGSYAYTSQVGIGSGDFAFWSGNNDNNRDTAKFYVKKDGTLKATTATIEGTITTGNATITGGKIGGWYIGDKWLGNAATVANSSVGMSNYDENDSMSFWAGDKDNPPFFVRKNGELTAKNLQLSGGTLTLGDNGTITGTNGKVSIGNWTFDNNGMYYRRKDDYYRFDLGNIALASDRSFGMFYGISGEAYSHTGYLSLKAEGTIETGGASALPDGTEIRNTAHTMAEVKLISGSGGNYLSNVGLTYLDFDAIRCSVLTGHYALNPGDNGGVLAEIRIAPCWYNYNNPESLGNDIPYPDPDRYISIWDNGGSYDDGLAVISMGGVGVSEIQLWGSIVSGSSREYKENIKSISNREAIIDKLEPISFTYKDDGAHKTRFGLIYEDAIKILPEICCDNGKSKAINYVELVPILLDEIKSLRARIKKLEER